MSGTPRPGAITWAELTAENAEQLRDFYETVAGWTPEPVSMGGYSNYAMNDGDAAAIRSSSRPTLQLHCGAPVLRRRDQSC
jgi:predicted enzyme related to lactoylglutathione lyase